MADMARIVKGEVDIWQDLDNNNQMGREITNSNQNTVEVNNSVNQTYPGKGVLDVAQAIRMRFIQGRTFEEIGKYYGITKSAVYQRLKTVKNMLGDKETIDAWDEYRVPMLKSAEIAALGEMLNPAKLKDASFNNLAYGLRQIHDMRNLREGLATERIDHNVVLQDATKVTDEITRMQAEIDRLQSAIDVTP